jgi:hypothetical protein
MQLPLWHVHFASTDARCGQSLGDAQLSVQPDANIELSHLSDEHVLPPIPQYSSALTHTF